MTHHKLALALFVGLVIYGSANTADHTQQIQPLTQTERSRLLGTLAKFAATSDLHVAVQMNDTIKARNLVIDGANIYARDAQDRTPMDIAQEIGDEEMIRILSTRARATEQ